MKFLQLIAVLILAAVVSYATVQFAQPQQVEQNKESAYERVIRTGVLRCAYFPFSPNLIIDPNSGKKSGIFYELTEEIAKRLSLRVDWSEEVGYGVIAQGFETNRYDIFCNTVWPTPGRSREASFSRSLYYGPEGLFVRADDSRFDNGYMKLNSPEYTFVIRDGDISDVVKKAFFPHAKAISVPQLASIDQPFIEVASGKADAYLSEPIHMYKYNENAEIKLKNLTPLKPVKYFPNTYMFAKNEFQLKQMLDTTINELIAEGYIDELLTKYLPEDKYPNAVFRTAQPYETE